MLVVEALLRAWGVHEAAWRLRLRLIPLGVPVLLVPLYFLTAPWRIEPWFASRYAVFAGERWNLLAIGPIGVGDLVLVLAAGLGAALFLRDALPPLLDRVRQGPTEEAGPWSPIPHDVSAIVEREASRLAIPPPAIHVVTSRWPVLFARGSRAPALVISAATLDALAPHELEAALAHELAHVRYRDPAWGYVLIAVRALNFFNPAIHWAARAVVDEIERRADQATVSAGIGAVSLASAIVTLFDRSHPAPVTGSAIERLAWRARALGVERRRERLVADRVPSPPPLARTRFALAAGGLAALLFFVV